MKLDSLYQKLESKATPAMVAFLFAVCMIFNIGFDWRHEKLGVENKPLDTRFLYSPAEVSCLFTKLGDENLKLYAITELTLDLVFPFLYVALLAFLIIQVYSAEKAKYLILLPILAGFSDLAENFTIAFLAFTFNHFPSDISYLASAFTASKLLLLLICLVILLVGSILALRKQDS